MADDATSIPETADDIAAKILEVLSDNPDGIGDKTLTALLGSIPTQSKVDAVNKLLSDGQIEVLKNPKAGNQLFYRKVQDPSKVKDFDDEERVVYDIIKIAGNKGIWSRDIREKCNLPMTHVTKVLKHLESKKIIKSVKSVSQGKKKVYMLAELEPHRDVTGGVWYENQHFEQEFIDVLHRYCAKFIQQKYELAKDEADDPRLQFQASLVSISDVCEHIKATQISRIELKKEEIESVLDAVCYDGLITRHVQVIRNPKTKQSENVVLYRYRPSLAGDVGALYTPCNFCPVIKDCDNSSEINPRTCAYITEWLQEEQSQPSNAPQIAIKSEPSI